MNITVCNICREEFQITLKEAEIKNGISKVYFNCPHCSAEYISYYTNVLIKRKQHEMRTLQARYEKVRVKDPLQASKLMEKWQKMKKAIGRDMEKLEKRVKDKA